MPYKYRYIPLSFFKHYTNEDYELGKESKYGKQFMYNVDEGISSDDDYSEFSEGHTTEEMINPIKYTLDLNKFVSIFHYLLNVETINRKLKNNILDNINIPLNNDFLHNIKQSILNFNPFLKIKKLKIFSNINNVLENYINKITELFENNEELMTFKFSNILEVLKNIPKNFKFFQEFNFYDIFDKVKFKKFDFNFSFSFEDFLKNTPQRL
jgi:hypothetical protein